MTKTLADQIDALEWEARRTCTYCHRRQALTPIDRLTCSCGASYFLWPLTSVPYQVVHYDGVHTISFRCRDGWLAAQVARRMARQWGLS